MDLYEAVQDFLVESHEYLGEIEKELLFIEREGPGTVNLTNLKQLLHTLKGTSGCFGFGRLASLAHLAEDGLEHLLDKSNTLNGQRMDFFFKLVDALRETLFTIETQGHEGERDFEELKGTLATLKKPVQEPLSQPHPPSKNHLISEKKGTPETPSFDQSLSKEDQISQKGSQKKSSSLSENFVRVSTAVVEELASLSEELVLIKNELEKILPQAFLPSFQKLSRITTQLQERVMKTRMQPLDRIWENFPRLLRDSAQQSGKILTLESKGGKTELDKFLIEQLREPLVHLLQNALDHGIELPEERKRVGKPEEGIISLKAYQKGGWVYIEVSDDGRGICPKKIGEVALKKGILNHQELSVMAEEDLRGLIFHPGFSTASRITNFSGRGVGMGTIKRAIEKMEGNLLLKSQPGLGAQFQIQIPLTLMVLPVLIVFSGDFPFAIPQARILDVRSIPQKEFFQNLQKSGDLLLYPCQNNLVPISFLGQALKLEEKYPKRDEYPLVFVDFEEVSFGLVVDQIGLAEEIVVKPLSQEIQKLSLYSGGTLLENGQIALILDLVEYFKKTEFLSSEFPKEKSSFGKRPLHPPQKLLLFKLKDSELLGIFLSRILSIQRISPGQIETREDSLFIR